MFILFEWCDQCGIQKILYLIKTLINIMRWVVPIGLIIMTSLDIAKKVLNPDEKEGQQKIMRRVIAALLVFFVPLFIRIVLGLVDIGLGRDTGAYNSTVGCWNKANITCQN